MSDFLAIVAINGTVLHLVDWDKPCWFKASAPRGERVIPHPDYFITDALAVLAAGTVNHLVDLRVQVDHLVVQQVEQIALSVDPEWSVDLAGMEVSMGAASIRIAKAKDKNGD